MTRPERRDPRNLASDRRGGAAIEFAIAAPIFLTVLLAIIQFGIVSLARSGLEQAVEAGARYATIYPRPSDAAIKAKVLASKYGLNPASITGPTIVYGTRNGMAYAEISMDYALQIKLPFYAPHAIRLSHKRLAYLAPVS